MEVTLQMSESARLREALDRAKSRALAWTPSFGPEPTWQISAAAIVAIYQNALHEAGCDGCAEKSGPFFVRPPYEIVVNKSECAIRFADETEEFVRIVLEKK